MDGFSEATKIAKQIAVAGSPTFSCCVLLNSDQFVHCVENLIQQVPSTVILLCSFAPTTQDLIVAVIVPAVYNDRIDATKWIETCISSVSTQEAPPRWDLSTDTSRVLIRVATLNQEQTAEKASDVVRGVGAHYIKKSGVFTTEDEEEHEYGFDDI